MAMSMLESFLIKYNVVSGTFDELANSKFDHTHNRKRLFVLVFNVLIAIRWLVLLMFNSVEVCNLLGDVLWTNGLFGFLMYSMALVMTLIAIWYKGIICYCEYHGQLAFLNDLVLATQIKSVSSIALTTKTRILCNVLVLNAFALRIISTGIFAIGAWKAYEINQSIVQTIYNLIWAVISVTWGVSVGVYTSSVSVLVYLTASLINEQLSSLYNYLKLCRDPFTLDRVLLEYTEVIVKIYRSNKFVKFVLGSVNTLAIPAVSISLSIFTLDYDGLFIKNLVGMGSFSFLVLLTLTGAFMASVHFKVRRPNVS